MGNKKEYGTDGNNGTDGKVFVKVPFIPLFPSVPYSLRP
jgi:hypothetical protein